jgi:hypothetical protein
MRAISTAIASRRRALPPGPTRTSAGCRETGEHPRPVAVIVNQVLGREGGDQQRDQVRDERGSGIGNTVRRRKGRGVLAMIRRAIADRDGSPALWRRASGEGRGEDCSLASACDRRPNPGRSIPDYRSITPRWQISGTVRAVPTQHRLATGLAVVPGSRLGLITLHGARDGLDWGSRGRRFKSCRPDIVNEGGTRSSGAALAASTSGDARNRCLRRGLGG